MRTLRALSRPGVDHAGARGISVLWICAALFCGADRQALAAQSGWADALSSVAESLASDVVDDDIGGIAIGVVVDGDLVWAQAFGVADREAGTPMATSSILRTGSISKSVTALLMMRLVDRGLVRLDDPVRLHLPEIDGLADRRAGADEVTLRHLASHTAGIVREPAWPGSVVGPIDAWEARVLESIPHTSYDSIPGARYQYSNIGFGILGLALSRAADRPYMDLVREEIFGPLGMIASEFVVAGAELDARLAEGYVSRNETVSGDMPRREHAGRGYKVPNGGVYSTVADLGRFLGALQGVPGLRVITERSRAAMLEVHTPEDPTRGYGLGLQIRRYDDGTRTVGHGGSVAGYNAHMAVDPDAGIGVVLLRNYTGGSTNLAGVAYDLVAELRALGR